MVPLGGVGSELRNVRRRQSPWQFTMEQFAADDARVLVVDTAGKLDGAPSGQYDGVVVEGSAGNVEFRDVLRVLRPSGRCVVRTGVKSSALIFAGFVNVAQQDGMVRARTAH